MPPGLYRVSGFEVDEETLERWIEEELELHRLVFERVRRYFDELQELGVDTEQLQREDPATYWALQFELARSLYISLQNRARSMRRQR